MQELNNRFIKDSGKRENLKLKILRILNANPKLAEEILVEMLREKECPFYDLCGENYLEDYKQLEFI